MADIPVFIYLVCSDYTNLILSGKQI